MPLFNPKTVAAGLISYDRTPAAAEESAAKDWAARAREDFGKQNESQLEPEFNHKVMQQVLGYRPLGPDGPGTIKAKQSIGAGTVDLALGRFTADVAEIAAPLELKGPKTALDAIMPGRHKTPVQQAWEYANDAPGAKWVLVSEMRWLRLYAIGHGRADYEQFDLRKIDEPEELRRLQLFLHADQLLGGATAELLARSAREDRDITAALYKDYRTLRADLMQFVRDQRPAVTAEDRIALVQKLLDRLVFTAFAEDSILLPPDTLRDVIEKEDAWEDSSKWERVRRLFAAIDKGRPKAGIDAYNGGLFAGDEALDALDLPDPLVARFREIYAYDFKSEVSVAILGHIFEQSISDIEAMQAEARGEPPPATGKRKRDGVVYTPDFITRFIIERTIGAHMAEVSAALMAEHAAGEEADGTIRWKGAPAERAYWEAYLERLTGLKVLDPACGSGAFLIAAFEWLNAEQRRVRERLAELTGDRLSWLDPNADLAILEHNLFGVDVNAESVEITKLSLWLETARKGRALNDLSANIRWGNSLIEDSDIHARAFAWEGPFAKGSFDVVVGNPPYVRMELLKSIKPYLQKRYAVVSDRADLYAYFFELGLRALKPGARLGYISSSTFFRTGSGAPLRKYLSEAAAIEAVIDFGDLQLFDGVTTYPTIVTMRKHDDAQPAADDLRFLNVKMMPSDLSLAFAERAEAMPRARLAGGSWRFEGDRLDSIRAKMAAGRKTLAELYGPPLYGIKTGLNEAFVVSRDKRDSLIARDGQSEALLKPFLIGENLKRWHVESDDLWLIYTPRNRIEIDDYPAIRDHLAAFRERLEARATKQKWWELQQAQAAYEERLQTSKIVYPEMSQGPKFSIDRSNRYVSNKVFFIPHDDPALTAYLGSKCSWLTLFGEASPLRGGQWRLELREQYMSKLPVPSDLPGFKELTEPGTLIQSSSDDLVQLDRRILHRLADIAPEIPAIASFRAWPQLDFSALRALIGKRCKTDISLLERDDWESWFETQRTAAADLKSRIADAEAEINARVYRLLELGRDEIDAIEESLAGQY